MGAMEPQPERPVEAARPVLIWRADDQESRVAPSLADAAEFLSVDGQEVLAAIESGEMLGDWFVDWEASA